MPDRTDKAQAFLPLTEATYYILTSLGTPRHGYAVIQAVGEMSGGSVELGPGTLYGAFQRLLKQQLIERMDGPDPEDERRKLYRLTPLGLQVVALQVERFRDMVHYGEQVLSAAGGEVNGDHE